jgi:hypothetical protein
MITRELYSGARELYEVIREPDPYLPLSPKESTVFQGDAATGTTREPEWLSDGAGVLLSRRAG